MTEENPQEDITIEMPSAGIYVTPPGFQIWAGQFLSAAKEVSEAQGFSPVRLFLACRSIELALKGFLLAQEYTAKRLSRRVGHDLRKALRKAKRAGLDTYVALTQEQEDLIASTSDLYSSKAFEYFEMLPLAELVRGFPNRPDINALIEIAEVLVAGVRQPCFDAADL